MPSLRFKSAEVRIFIPAKGTKEAWRKAVQGKVLGDLGYSGYEHEGSCWWSLTHLPTGLAVQYTPFSSEALVRDAVKILHLFTLLQGIDLSEEGGDVHAHKDVLGQVVREIVSMRPPQRKKMIDRLSVQVDAGPVRSG